MSVPFGFQLEDVVDPVAKSEFGQFMAALQAFMASYTFKDVPFSPNNVYGSAPGLIIRDEGLYTHLSYRVIQGIMDLSFSFQLVATTGGFAYIRIPENYRAPERGVWVGSGWMSEAGVGFPVLFSTTGIPQDNVLIFIKASLAGFANTAGAFTTGMRGSISFPVTRL